MNNIFSDLIKEAGNEYAALVDDGIEAGDVTGYIGTGSYALNALLSGSIYGGLPDNKITALAGEPATGKTFYTLNVVKQFLIDNPNGGVMYFESESALTKQMFIDRDIDARRVHIIPVTTIQEFRTQCVKILDKYMETPAADRPPMIMVLDSLGNLSTEKEIADITEGKDTRDMTRAQLIRGAFRVITLKLGKAKVALLVTNHTYDVVGCALAGTMISTVNGNVDISQIKTGDVVNTLVGPKRVKNTFVYDTDEYYKIILENGQEYNLTGEHKLMTQEGEWKKVIDLREEDVIISL
jgi:RecA/RadA recombinase